MSRWEPDARGRMIRAALELYAERGFEQTTAADIAERAGVTERTFFRHFPDKREVLFDGASAVLDAVRDAIAAAPAEQGPLDAALTGMASNAEFLEGRRDHSALRSRVIAANPALRERELLKYAGMAESAAEALRARGVAEPAASLAADSAVTVFRAAYARWIGEPEPPRFAECVAQAAEELRALV